MNPLANILSATQVLLDLEAGSKKRVFEQAGMLFESHLGLARAVVFESLFAREKLGSTGLGQGIAIPHGRIKGLKQAAGAFLRLATPVPFDSPDGRPVNLLFVLLVPEQATEQHLQILSELAQRFAEKPFREALLAATDPAAVVTLFQV
ncbi:PTS IIA-like nitrogen regulatory protein PtsN [Dechloromonas sp. TW-R-39-2]|uniref:PTS IIA-like nitrogen regulatory protein PtsN n=1 Tax=Dechloromonas sp. TW-R-39-2 TaxID=2654218 RepID=UPI00193DD7C7|nr:PTS IIA-like nitrogen regulatory protein PtsN [Dechloromonas sp. TW-R-39-2]QRM18167.1 PTS IIA-like nitrogen regulatory protein PtsN [Dechloromonas sp. TW-R-39-2]